MPLPCRLLLGALLPACAALSACTATTSTEAVLASAAHPELPETVAAVPSFNPRPGNDFDVASTAEITPAAYAAAGPGPNPFGRIDAPEGRLGPGKVAANSPELDALIARYAAHYQVPVELVRRVVRRESNFRPEARNGPYWGLMQILPQTAHTMGYRGPARGLLDAETNLKYAVKYLRGAYITAGGNHDHAVRLYARGYYYDAKRKGLLKETGLRG